MRVLPPTARLARRALSTLIAAALAFAGDVAFAADPDLGDTGDVATPDSATTPAKTTPERTWIKHRVIQGERLDEVAERYGVTRTEIVRWNKSLQKKQWIYGGRELKVWARVVPPPREKITYTVQFGDTWAKIASRYGVRDSDLKTWNPKVPRAFKAGQRIMVWTNPQPTAAKGLSATSTEALPVFDVPRGGYSMGLPTRGKLVNGVQLPDTDDYDVRRPDEAWGASHTILNVQKAIALFRRGSGYEGKLIVGAISKKNGGRFRPHRSHQSGRDVDIRLPKKAGADLRSDNPDDIDWVASWKLIKSFIDTGEAEYIFLDYSRQRRLLNAAKSVGVGSEDLEKYIQYPRGRHENKGVVRHNEGHLIHIHVRISCPDDQSRCDS